MSEARLAELISTGGLTAAGEKRLRAKTNDVRCRPEKRYASYFPSGRLPQFRLMTVEDAARAEDCVMVWAYVCGKGAVEHTFTCDSEAQTISRAPAAGSAILCMSMWLAWVYC